MAKGKNFIIGIGASAGGMEAIHEMFDNMPSSTQFTFVVVQHLSSDYKSLMPELLSRHTNMQVHVAENDMSVEPNCIYLIPNKYMMTVANNKLHLHEKLNNHQPNNAIDIFFESLGKAYKEDAVGVILSGTGTDGTRGVEIIKSHGGTIVVQDPMSAKFDGMPNSAIATGYADIILPPEMIPEELIEYLEQSPLIKSFNDQNNKDEHLLNNILDAIKDGSDYDFREYKKPTIQRRLAKRMGELRINSMQDYLVYIHNNPQEVKEISKEFLIRVTRFFRDADAFDQIYKSVIPVLFKDKKKGDTIKVWVIACSTGEEAYSLGIQLLEYQASEKVSLNIKIFATDIDNEALEIASRGIYKKENIEGEVPVEWVAKYFIKEGQFYKVGSELRKLVVFAHHDIINDPPFSKVDLITCRNMLIYMSPVLQKSIMKAFQFALNLDGFIFLGPSENIGILKDHTIETDRKWKIYQCSVKPGFGDISSFINPERNKNYSRSIIDSRTKSKNGIHFISDIFKETLLEENIIAGFFIDQEFDVKQATGHFKAFIDFPETNFNFNLLKLVHPDLSSAISISVRKAIKNKERVVMNNVKIHIDSGPIKMVNIIVKPYLNQKEYLQPFIFVILQQLKEEAQPEFVPRITNNNAEMFVEMERELKETRENLQALLEEVESANEELQTSNEEIISSNEELQSTNEELQSLNEELHTVNVEHQLKIRELIELNDDLNNYFRNTDIGQIIVDKKLSIRKFSPAATKQINLIGSDIGRSIIDISNNFKQLDFINDIKKVLTSGIPVQKEVEMGNESLFLMKLNPYLRVDKVIDGVVISFVDITEIKRLTSILKAVLNSSPSGITAKHAIRNESVNITDFDYIMCNSMAASIMNVDENKILGKRMREEYVHMKDEYFERYVQVVESGTPDKFEFRSPDNNRWYEIVCVKMQDGLVTTFTDITENKSSADLLLKGYEDLKVTSEQLQNTNDQLETSNMDLYQFASIASHDLKEPLRKIQAFGNLLEDRIRNKIDASEKNYLDKIIKSSARMQNLIEDVLTFSRLSSTELPLTKADLTEVVKTVVDDLEISVQAKNAKVITDELPVLELVVPQMQQLFHNLIANALKFNESKPPVIEIRNIIISKELEAKLSISAHDFYAITVKDNGIGFDESFSDKVFKMFQRLHPSSYTGTGIGLAICKKIAENHGGFIHVESKIGEGSCFFILLPKENGHRNKPVIL